MVLQGDEARVQYLVSVNLYIVLILTQDNYKFCTECTLVSKIILAHPMELLGDVGHVESRFVLYGDSVSVGAR